MICTLTRKNLQTKLADLERHKGEYNRKVEDWTQKKESQRKKLKMTQDMLRQLEKQKNKVRYSCGDVGFFSTLRIPTVMVTNFKKQKLTRTYFFVNNFCKNIFAVSGESQKGIFKYNSYNIPIEIRKFFKLVKNYVIFLKLQITDLHTHTSSLKP